MRWIGDGENWSDAEPIKGRRVWPCAFCGGSITPGESMVKRHVETAHYACAPGLGAPTYQVLDWVTPCVGACSDIGVGGRDENQDAWASATRSDGRIRLVVADGMGGHPGGKAAAEAAVRGFSTENTPVDVVLAADARVRAAGRGRPSGTTFCFAEVRRTSPQPGRGEGREVVFSQVGDSTGHLRRVQSGKNGVWRDEVLGMTRRQGHGNLVLQCLGAGNGREVATPIVTRFPASPGDVVLLHTDGVDPAVESEVWRAQIAPMFGRSTPQAIAEALVRSALRHGSTDNATAVVFVVP